MVTTIGLLLLTTVSAACRTQDALTTEHSQIAVSAGSVTLTYLCGNTFRVRNTNSAAVTVRWDVYGTAESGTLILAPKPANAPYSEVFFSTQHKGTVRLFEGAVLLQTKANGGKPPCQTPAASWPPLSTPLPQFDSTQIVDDAVNGQRYFGTDLKLRFREATPDSTIVGVFGRHNITVVGRLPNGSFFVRVPPPSSFDALLALVAGIQAEPTVAYVMPIRLGSAAEQINSRWPDDGPGYARRDYVSGAATTWGARAMRLPLAWGCENGTYGTSTARVALLEKRVRLAPDFTGSVVAVRGAVPLSSASVSAARLSQASLTDISEWERHASFTTSVMTATGNNGTGVAGVLWRSEVFVYETVDPNRYSVPFEQGFYSVVARIAADAPQVLSISTDQLLPRQPSVVRNASIESVRADVVDLLRSTPSLLIVVAAGNDRFIGTRATFEARDSLPVLLAALLRLKDSLPKRIVVVSASDDGNVFPASFPSSPARGANFFEHLTDILAPGTNIPVLAPDGSIVIASGTSLAAPAVAGILGQVLSMYPRTPVDALLGLLRQGAQSARERSSDGRISAAPVVAVPGIPGGALQADAYGTLRAVSSSFPTAPLCGIDVEGRTQSDGAYQIVAHRSSPEILVSLPASAGAWTFSVAQGGRRLAIDGYDRDLGMYQSFTYELSGGAWRHSTVEAGVARLVYLERDTAYFSFRDGPNGNFDLWLRIGSDSPDRRTSDASLTTGLPGVGSIWNWNANYISPTGDFALIEWRESSGSCFSFYTIYAVAARAGAARQAIQDGCRDGTNLWLATTWRGDGTELLTVQSSTFGSVFQQFTRWTTSDFSRRPPESVASAGLVSDLSWSPEGGQIRVTENIGNVSCIVTTRSVNNLSLALEGPRPVPLQSCQDPVMQTLPAVRSDAYGAGPEPSVPLAAWRRGPPRVPRTVRHVN